MKIGVISPIPGAIGVDDSGDIARLTAKARPGTELAFVYTQGGKPWIEGAYDDALAVPGVLKAAIEFEHSGMQAIVINCTADTGLNAVRECVSIPVVAPMMASMHLAAQLSSRFSIVTFMERTCLRFEEMARNLGLSDRLASVELISFYSENIENSDEMLEQLFEAGVRCVKEHKAHAMILGCTALEMAAGRLREKFKDAGIEILLLEPYSIALHLAEDLVDMGLSHSKLTYPSPREL